MPEDSSEPEEVGAPPDQVPAGAEEALANDQEPEEQIVTLEERVEQLEEALSEAREQAAERTDQLARVQANFENYRKRMRRERAEDRAEVRAEMVRHVVEVLDDLERATSSGSASDKVNQGVEMVRDRLGAKLADLGVVRIEPDPGDRLDPQIHEALLAEATEEVDDGCVVETLRAGYELDGRLVRPALVKVARAPEPPSSDAAAGAAAGTREGGDEGEETPPTD